MKTASSQTYFAQTSVFQLINLRIPVCNVKSVSFQLISMVGVTSPGDVIWLDCDLNSKANVHSSTTANGQLANIMWLQPFPIPTDRASWMPPQVQYLADAHNNSVQVFGITLRGSDVLTVADDFKANWLITFHHGMSHK